MFEKPFSLESKSILVTGATSGIGRNMALYFAQCGAKIIATGRNAQELENLKNEITGLGHTFIVADMLENDGIVKISKSVDSVDGFVNCAGIDDRCLFKFSEQESFDKVIDTNFTSAVNLTRNLVKSKKINKGGSVLFIASISAQLTTAGLSAYSASKAAIISFAKALAIELAARKIRVNTISPGVVSTRLTEKLFNQNPELRIKDQEKYLLGHGNVDDIAYLAQYFMADASKWVTGSNFVIDGGYSCQK